MTQHRNLERYDAAQRSRAAFYLRSSSRVWSEIGLSSSCESTPELPAELEREGHEGSKQDQEGDVVLFAALMPTRKVLELVGLRCPREEVVWYESREGSHG